MVDVGYFPSCGARPLRQKYNTMVGQKCHQVLYSSSIMSYQASWYRGP